MELIIIWTNGTKRGRTHRETVHTVNGEQEARELVGRMSGRDGFQAGIFDPAGENLVIFGTES